MRTLRFNREKEGRWYVDLPEWEGEKADLEMVSGADSMLEMMSENNEFVDFVISTEKFEGCDRLKFIREANEVNNGAIYSMDYYKGTYINLNMWLCDVTKFVFGDFPESLYVMKTN